MLHASLLEKLNKLLAWFFATEENILCTYDESIFCLRGITTKPLSAYSGLKQLHNLDDIFQAKAKLGKYMKEKC